MCSIIDSAMKIIQICLFDCVKLRTVKSLLSATLLIFTLVLSVGCENPSPKPTGTSTFPEAPNQPSLSKFEENQYHQALAYLAEEQEIKSEKILAKLAKKYPDDAGIKVNLATAFFKQSKFKQAEQICLEVKINNNTSPELYNLMGLISMETKQFTKAETEFQTALKINQNHANSSYNLALLYDIYFQDIPKAYQYYVKYLALVPDDQATKDWIDQLKYSLDQE